MRSLALWLVFAAAPLACAQGEALSDGGGTGGFSGIGGSGGHSGTGGFNGTGGTGGSGGSPPRPDASTVDAAPMPIDAPPPMMIDAAPMQVDAPPQQTACGGIPVTILTIGFDQTFTTTGGTDHFQVTGSSGDLTNCLDGDGQGFPDKLFQLTLAAPTSITVSVDHPETTFPIVMYVRNADCVTYAGCSGDFFGQQPALSGTNVAAGTYFFIVDGISSSGTFRLTVTSP